MANKFDLQNFARATPHTQIENLKELFNPVTFAEALLGYKLFDYQKAILLNDDRKLHIRKGRQVGASLTLAMKAVHRAVTRPYTTVAVISPSQRQSSLVFKYIKDMFLSHELLKPEIGKAQYSQTVIELLNGSIIYSLPCGSDGRTIRGISLSAGSMMIVDEAAFIPEKVWSAIDYFTATGGQEILSSTPLAKLGKYYEASEDKTYSHLVIPSWMNPLIEKEWLEERKKSYSYASEIAAEFMDGEGKFFPFDIITAAINADLSWEEQPAKSQGMMKMMGIDLGIEQDPSVITICRKVDKLQPVFMKAYKKDNGKGYEADYEFVRSYDEIVSKAKQLKELYDVTYAAVDATNNAYVSESLEKHMTVFPIKFNSTAKNGNPMKTELMYTLHAALVSGKLEIPNHPVLIRQLANYEYSITENKNVKFSPKDEDFIDSLALCIYNELAIKEPDVFGVA
jgi:hypothetical protein